MLKSKGHDEEILNAFGDGYIDDVKLALLCERVNAINPRIIDNQTVLMAIMEEQYKKTQYFFGIKFVFSVRP